MRSEENEGSFQLPNQGADWARELTEALCEIVEKRKLPNKLELEAFEHKLKHSARGAFKKLLDLDRVFLAEDDNKVVTDRVCREAGCLSDVLNVVIKHLGGDNSRISRELRSFMDDLYRKLRQLCSDHYRRMRPFLLWPHAFHPYLRVPIQSKLFLEALHEFFFEEHEGLRKNVEPVFRQNLRNEWKNDVWGVTKDVLEFKGRKAGHDGQKTYRNAIDSIRLWRNASVHYKNYLPSGKKEVKGVEIEEEIFQQFPGGYEKIYKSVATIIGSDRYLDKEMRGKLRSKLAEVVKASTTGDAGGQIGERTGSMASQCQPFQQISARTPELTASRASRPNGKRMVVLKVRTSYIEGMRRQFTSSSHSAAKSQTAPLQKPKQHHNQHPKHSNQHSSRTSTSGPRTSLSSTSNRSSNRGKTSPSSNQRISLSNSSNQQNSNNMSIQKDKGNNKRRNPLTTLAQQSTGKNTPTKKAPTNNTPTKKTPSSNTPSKKTLTKQAVIHLTRRQSARLKVKFK